MTNRLYVLQIIFILLMAISCSHNNTAVVENKEEQIVEKEENKLIQFHQFDGWYCPDNIIGFPAVDISNWESVPVVEGRLPTKEETENETSLIFVDTNLYPSAKAIDTKLPKLARFYNIDLKQDELVIIIQAINVLNDSIVGFRYLNGGNGSAFWKDVDFLSDIEIDKLMSSRFVSFSTKINAPQSKIWDVLTNPKFRKSFEPIFNDENILIVDWNASSKVNFKLTNVGVVTSEFAEKLYGNFYIQIDYLFEGNQYVEKFFLLENKQTKVTELKIICGPYISDFENQKTILNNWAQKVKELSEKVALY